jgi:hypothetical protein
MRKSESRRAFDKDKQWWVVVDIPYLRDQGYYYAITTARRLRVNSKNRVHHFSSSTERGYSRFWPRTQELADSGGRV